jgi:uncharacterized membrane protein
MMTRRTVDVYLDRLDEELSDLPGDRRRELVDEIRGHIDEALSATREPTEADVRNILDRLGDPADIAEEARERLPIRRVTPTWREWAAVALLPFGGLLIVVVGIVGVTGWIVGAILLLSSRIWSRRDKILGLLLFPGGLTLPAILLVWGGKVCSSSTVNRQSVESCTGYSLPPALGIPLLIILIVTPLAVAAHLASKLRNDGPGIRLGSTR